MERDTGTVRESFLHVELHESVGRGGAHGCRGSFSVGPGERSRAPVIAISGDEFHAF